MTITDASTVTEGGGVSTGPVLLMIGQNADIESTVRNQTEFLLSVSAG